MSYHFNEYVSRDVLLKTLTDVIAGQLHAALSEKGKAVFSVPGGSSPGPVFDALSQTDLDWPNVQVVLNDERWVPEDHDRSNTRLLHERLLVNKASSAGYLPLYAPFDTPEEGLPQLNAAIESALPIDVLLLGMGGDMHTASLFPGADKLTESLASDAPILLPMRAPGAPEPRITLSARVLNGASHKHILIFGADKRRALDDSQSLPLEEAPVRSVSDGAEIHWAE